MNHHDKLDQLLVTKLLLNDCLEVKVLAINVSENVVIDPIQAIQKRQGLVVC